MSLKNKPLNKEALFGKLDYTAAAKEWEDLLKNRSRSALMRSEQLEKLERELRDSVEESRKKEKKPTELNTKETQQYSIPPAMSADEYPWGSDTDVWNGSFNPNDGIFETAQTQYSKRRSILSRPLSTRTPEELRYLDMTTPIKRNGLSPYASDITGAVNRLRNIMNVDSRNNNTSIRLSQQPVGSTELGDYSGDEISTWAKDVFANVIVDKNDTEILKSIGTVTRAREKQNYLKQVDDFLNYISELGTLKAEIENELDSQNLSYLTGRYAAIKELADRYIPILKEASTYDYETPTKSQYVGTSPSSGIGIYIPNNSDEKTNNKILNLLNDYLNNLDGLLNNVENRNKSIRDGIDLYNNYVENTVIPAERAAVQEDINDLKRINRFHEITPEFKARAEAAKDMRFLDLDTYLYGMWGTIGSSASYNGFLLLSQALKIAGAATSIVAPEVGIPLSLAGGAVGIEAGKTENDAEVAENYTNSLIHKLERADKLTKFVKDAREQVGDNSLDIKGAILAFVFGDYVPKDIKIREIAQDAAWGANNLFENDMMAVAYSEAVESAISAFVPLGNKIAKSVIGNNTKRAIGRKLVDFTTKHPSTKGFVHYATGMLTDEAGYAVGAAVSPIAGAATAAAAPAVKKAFRPLVKKVGDAIMYSGERALAQADKVLTKRELTKGSLSLIKRQLGIMAAEGEEEGKQYLHGLIFENGGYKGDAQGLIDIISNDIEIGSRAAYSFIGGLFFGMETDPELLANMRGGIILPMTNHSTIVTTLSTFGLMYKDIQADKIVANNVMAMKASDRLDIQNAQSYARAARKGNLAEFRNAFDKMYEIQNKLTRKAEDDGSDEIPAFTKEEVNEQRELFERVVKLANSGKIRSFAELRGIDTNSNEYDTYVALISYFKNLESQSLLKVDEIGDAIKKTSDLVLSNEEFDVLLDNGDNSSLNFYHDVLNNWSINSPKITVDPQRDDESDEDYQMRTKAEYRSQMLNAIQDTRNEVDQIAELYATLEMIEQLGLFETLNKTLRKLLDFAHKKVSAIKSDLVLTGDKFKLSDISNSSELDSRILDIDAHNTLKDLYRQLILNAFDYQENLKMLHVLVGIDNKERPILSDAATNSMINRIYTDIYNSRATTKALNHSTAKDVVNDYLKAVKKDDDYVQSIYDEMQVELDLRDKKELEEFAQQLEDEKRIEREALEDNEEFINSNEDDFMDLETNKKLYNAPTSSVVLNKEQPYTEEGEIVESDRKLHKNISKSTKALLSNILKIQDKGSNKPLIDKIRSNVHSLENAVKKGAILTPGEQKILSSAIARISLFDSESNRQQQLLFDQLLTTEPVTANEQKEDVQLAPQYTENQKKYEEAKKDADDALSNLKRILGGKSGKLFSGIDPEVFTYGGKLVAAYVRMGYYKFAEIAPLIIEQLGSEVSKFIKTWYVSVKYSNAVENADLMDSIDTILDIDVDDTLSVNASETKSWFFDINLRVANLGLLIEKTDNVEEADKLLYQDIKVQVLRFQEYANKIDDYKSIDDILSYFDDLVARKNTLVKGIDDLFNKINDLYEYAINPITNRSRNQSGSIIRTYESQSYTATGGVHTFTRLNNTIFESNNKEVEVIENDKKVGTIPMSHFRELMANKDFLVSARFVVNPLSYAEARKLILSSPKSFMVDIYYTETMNDGKLRHLKVSNVPIVLSTNKEDLNNLVSKLDSLLLDINLKTGIAKLKDNVEPVLLVDASRTNGVIIDNEGYPISKNNGNQSLRTVTDAFHIPSDKLADLLTGNEYGQLGIAVRGNIMPIRHNNNQSSVPIIGFREGQGRVSGIVTYVMNLMYQEDGLEYSKHRIPIPLTPKQLTEDDVDLIIKCLNNYHTPISFELNGKKYDSPLLGRQIISLLIRFGRGAELLNNNFVFDFARNDDLTVNYKKVRISDLQRQSDNSLSKVVRIVDLNDAQQVQWLKYRLLGKAGESSAISVHYNDEFIMWHRTNDPDSVFKNLTQFFKTFNGEKGRAKIDHIKLSDSVQFDRSDVDPTNDNSYNGITALEWKIKNGHFLTAFNHIELPIVSFNNANSESGVSNQITGSIENAQYIDDAEQNLNVNLGEVDESDSVFEMFKILSEEAKNPIDRERAIKRIHKILGKKFPVRFVLSLIQLTQNGQAAVGYMSAFCKIILSDLAEEGTEFHEAFHEVFEFLIGEKRRQRIYTHYKNKYGKGRNLTPTQVSEELADMFMAFRNKVRDVHFTWNLKDTFNEIRSWANAFSELNDRKLAWLFFLTSIGVFKLNNPESRHTQERIDAFVKRHLSKQLYSTVSLDGEHIELKNIKSRKHLNDLLDLLVRKIIETNKNDLLGLNIKSIKLDKKSILTEVLAKDKELAKIQKAISENSENVPHSSAYRGLVGENLDGSYKDDAWLNSRSPIVRSNVLAYREIFENWGKIQSLLVTKIEALGGFKTKFVKYEQVESNLNEDSSNGSQIYDDIVSHDDGFYEFSRESDVSSAVRFLLSTIPAYRYATEEDIKNGTLDIKHRVVTELTEPVLDGQGKPIEDKNGKVKRSRILVPISVNSAGGAPFLSFKEVYQPLLKLLYDVKDVDDLQRRLLAAGNNNYVMSKIASALQTFRYKSIIRYNSDEHKELKDIPMVYYHNGVLVDPTSYINNVGGGLTHDELYMKYPVATRDIYDANGLLCRKGERIPGAFVVTNPDYESYTTLLFQAIKSQQLNFTFIYQNEVMDGEGKIIPGAVTYDADNTNSEYSQFHYPSQWFLNFLTLFNDALLDNKSKKPQTLSNVAKLLRSIMTDVTSENLRNKVKLEGDETTYDYNTTDGFDKIVTRFITLLNSVGITIDRGMFDYMLLQAFPFDDSPQLAFIDLLTDRSTTSMYPLIEPGGVFETMQYNLNAGDVEKFTKNSSSKINLDEQPTGSNIYSERGFIKYLALWYGRYKSASQEMQAIGPENTKLYMFAENHSVSDIMYDINQTEVDKDGNIFGSTVMKDMSKVDYVTTILNDGYRASSLIYKEMTKEGENERHDKLKLNTISGFKSFLKKDGGVKYVKLTPREVWLSRASLLSRGDIIFPTLSDKSSWFSISGINVPGLNYTNISSQDLFRINYVTGKMYLSFLDGLYGDNDILDQFIDYAWCDYKSALKVHEQLRTNEIPDNEKVKNFHTGTKNGERLGFLIGVWTDVYDERGNIVGEKYVSFNNNKSSIEDNLALAYKTFFEQREGESYNQYKSRQRSMIANNLLHRLKAELDNLVQMGIIEEVPDNANFIKENYNPSTGQYDKKITKLSYQFKYRNKFLDYNKIKVIANVYKNLITNKGFKYGDIYTSEQIESLAICAYVFDINNRAIMSQQEAQRFFTGMPHFFNWKYDKNTGDLIDMRADESKRYGGVGSTGANNRSDLSNISNEYTCAEIKDYEVKSALYNQMYEMFKDNEYRDALVNTLIQKDKNADYTEIYKKVYDRNGEYSDLNKVISELDEPTIKIVKHKIEAESNSYVKKINVADGAAYITDKMAENLLRQLGKYTNEVDKAFRYLRGDKKVFYTGKDGKKHVGDYLKDSDAYRVIVDALISTQKYSAFGYRMEHGIPVHFYNKFALFPLFKSISYGFTYELYKKMNDPEYGVDMVMFESAVKSGSEGALAFNPNIFREDDDPSNENNFIGDIANQNWKPANYIKDFTFKGHTYKQKYSFIRRQLNTDPREEETMALGTQVLKVMLATIKLQNDYNGVKGIDIRDNIMNAIVELSKIGATNIANKFLKRDGSVDLFKFSAFLKQELMLRDADLNILDAIEVVLDTDENGKPIEGSEHFRAPLDSVSNMKWIESILISNINKEVIDVNLPGNAYYQRSVFGMEGIPITAVLDNEDIHRYILNEGEDLALINEEGTMDAVISYDYFCNMTYIDDKGKRHSLIPENIKYNFEKGRQWLIDNGIIGRTSTANTIGYRIPTLALASVNALRFVDVINTVRDTIILPKEFTKLTGSDFKQYWSH